jgi:hypothetical protein
MESVKIITKTGLLFTKNAQHLDAAGQDRYII